MATVEVLVVNCCLLFFDELYLLSETNWSMRLEKRLGPSYFEIDFVMTMWVIYLAFLTHVPLLLVAAVVVVVVVEIFAMEKSSSATAANSYSIFGRTI